MKRTTMWLSETLRAKLQTEADRQGIPVAQLTRKILDIASEKFLQAIFPDKPMITRIHDEITLHEGASVHAEHFFWSPLAHAYDYDPADDGPECEIITRILASHPELAREAQ
jgi:hypothetical protein